MSYFLFEGTLDLGKKAQLFGEEAQHLLHVRRAKPGDTIEVQDQQRRHFQVVLEECSRHSLSFEVQAEIPAVPPSSLHLELVVGLTKEKALDWTIQKATELGVAKILIFNAHFSPRTIGVSQKQKALQRWEKIAQSACKQSRRQTPPDILLFSQLQEVFTSVAPCEEHWVFTPAPLPSGLPSANLQEIPRSFGASQRVVIGPEGGLHLQELTLAAQFGAKGVPLGERILRTETAVVAVSAILQFLFGDLGTSFQKN